MIADSHQHLIFPPSNQIAMMDTAGIDKTVLFPTTPHPERANTLTEFEQEYSLLSKVHFGNLPPEERINSLARITKELSDTVNSHPDRFWGFGTVPLFLSYNDTCRWIEERILTCGLIGLGEFSPATGQVKQMEVLFQAVSGYSKLPIWIHTFSPVTANDILELITLCEKYPKVKVIFGHMGGTNWPNAIHAAKSHQNIYLDLSAVFTVLAPTYAIKEVPNRTLFSSDAPYGNPLLSRIMVEQISPTNRVAQQVLGENLLALLSG